jgi:hypothetical protein
VNKYPNLVRPKQGDTHSEQIEGSDVFTFLSSKKKDLEKLNKMKEEKDLKDCTFTPKINARRKSYHASTALTKQPEPSYDETVAKYQN